MWIRIIRRREEVSQKGKQAGRQEGDGRKEGKQEGRKEGREGAKEKEGKEKEERKRKERQWIVSRPACIYTLFSWPAIHFLSCTFQDKNFQSGWSNHYLNKHNGIRKHTEK